MQYETNTRKIIARLLREGWTNVGGGRHDKFVKLGHDSIPVPRHWLFLWVLPYRSRGGRDGANRRPDMTRYIAIVDGKPGAFGISFPDAPGCVAMDTTVEEVIVAGGEVLAEWMGDTLAASRPLPKPRTPEKIRKDPEIAELLSTGGFMVSVPLVLDIGRPARANISLDAGLLSAIDEEARRQGVTRSAFLAAAARDKIREST